MVQPPLADLDQRVNNAIRAVMPHSINLAILPDHSLVLDLGFDSMKVALLSLALEEQLGRAILLERWMSSGSDPAALTVESLHQYVRHVLGGNEEASTAP